MVARQRFQAALRRSDRRDYSRRLRRQHHRLAGEYVRHARGPRRQRRARDVGRARRRDLYGVDVGRGRGRRRDLPERQERRLDRHALGVPGSAITGNATSLFVALQPGKTYGSGAVGRKPRDEVSRPCHPGQRGDQPAAHRRRHRAATAGSLLYASDFYGNRVRVFTTDGVWQRDISVSAPGALAVDGAGNVWVAQKSAGAIAGFSPAGALLNTIRMPAGSQPSALVFDAAAGRLLVGDEAPTRTSSAIVSGRPALAGTFGVRGGYLDTTTGIKGRSVRSASRASSGRQGHRRQSLRAQQSMGRQLGSRPQRRDRHSRVQQHRQPAVDAAVAELRRIAAPDPVTDGALFYGGTHV